jgi:hypothetical protein
MFESMLEILQQQFYIQMESEPHDFFVYPGDLSTYTLRCVRCGQPVTLADSIGDTLLHAPTTMFYHWNMNQSHDEQNHRESFTSFYELGNSWQWSSWMSAGWSAGKLSDFACFVA